MKRIHLLLAALLLITMLFTGCSNDTDKNHSTGSYVSITIIGDEEMGTILDAQEAEIEEGDTVYTITHRTAKEKGIQTETSGGPDFAYFKGINNLYESDLGPMSGWLYTVNGEIPDVGCSDYPVNEGDEILWQYSLDGLI